MEGAGQLSREELEQAILKGLRLVLRNAGVFFTGDLKIETDYLMIGHGTVKVVNHFFIREDRRALFLGLIPYIERTRLCCINPPQLHADGLRMSCWVYGNKLPHHQLGFVLQGLADSLLATLDRNYSRQEVFLTIYI